MLVTQYVLLFLGGRTRRAVAVDYSDCSVRISKHAKSGSDPKLLDLDIILVCAQPPAQKHVCDAMFKKDMVASCTDEDGKREPRPKTDPPKINPERYVTGRSKFLFNISDRPSLRSSRFIFGTLPQNKPKNKTTASQATTDLVHGHKIYV